MGSKGGAAPTAGVAGWAFLDHHLRNGFTVRWIRGEPLAYILAGKCIGDRSVSGPHVLATVAVVPDGWTDGSQIRELGMRWARAQQAAASQRARTAGPAGS